jgi:hypothetical protein
MLGHDLGETARKLLGKLSKFWQNNVSVVDPNYYQRLHSVSIVAAEEDVQPPLPFKSSSNAYFTSMYDAGNLIALGFRGAALRVRSPYNRAIIMHGASIIAAASYCESQGLLNGVSFSMVFPIKLVCLLSPSEEQKIQAQDVLLKWASGRGLTDICTTAAPSYLDRSHG